jgi:hypothetical protein
MPIRSTARAVAGSLAVVLIVLLALGGTAGAQTYSGGASLVVDDPTVRPGEPVTATASGFQPGSVVTFTLLGDVVGTAIADADGVATITFDMPSDLAPGEYMLVASGVAPDGSPLEVTTTITVVAAGTEATADTSRRDDPLARTGSDVQGLLRVGAVMLTLGAVLVLAVRKRSQSPTPRVDA